MLRSTLTRSGIPGVNSEHTWLEALDGGLVGLDSAPLIYALERHLRYVASMEAFLTPLSQSRLRVVTSAITLVEVLTHPLHPGNTALVEKYESFLSNTRGLAMVDLSAPVAREAARLRAVYNPRTPGAVQLATAISEGAGYFLTNDSRLARLTEIRVLVLNDLS